MKFLAQKNHPKLFKHIDISAEFKRHFKEFYGLDLVEKQIDGILKPSKGAGLLKSLNLFCCFKALLRDLLLKLLNFS
ncbi:hypothetical protein [Campylobacter troglodytis]|uniref:hypothetical protein n=1 Tax=Campylobacter troglodytis TaxID=654363 RepID=UPI00115B8875|nr:hypothetical protein [Campylobacter troglodytis]TQR61076.1 hypothetical protein DMC01_02785 [Campylobacter troglodytis]